MLQQNSRGVVFVRLDSVQDEDVSIFSGNCMALKLEPILFNDLLDGVLSVIDVSCSRLYWDWSKVEKLFTSAN